MRVTEKEYKSCNIISLDERIIWTKYIISYVDLEKYDIND